MLIDDVVGAEEKFITPEDVILHCPYTLRSDGTEGGLEVHVVKKQKRGGDPRVSDRHAGEDQVNPRGLTLIPLPEPRVPWPIHRPRQVRQVVFVKDVAECTPSAWFAVVVWIVGVIGVNGDVEVTGNYDLLRVVYVLQLCEDGAEVIHDDH